MGFKKVEEYRAQLLAYIFELGYLLKKITE